MKMKTKVLILILVLLLVGSHSFADNVTIPNISIDFGGVEEGDEAASTVQIILLLSILTLAPSILVMMTSFTRIIIILSFVRRALALQTTPPNQVLIGLALFLTFFVMNPTFTAVKENAYDPLVAGEITQEQAFDAAIEPMRDFMLSQVRGKDLQLFVDIANVDSVESYQDVPTSALIPAFVISEIKTGFEVGFLIFLPFIVIDMVVASTLMALGMLMLPPVMISLPFKLLLFIMMDGWNLIIEKTILTFGGVG